MGTCQLAFWRNMTMELASHRRKRGKSVPARPTHTTTDATVCRTRRRIVLECGLLLARRAEGGTHDGEMGCWC